MTTKANLRKAIIVLLVTLYMLMGSACSKQDGADVVNSVVMSQTQIEQAITGQFCDSDNVLSQCD